MSSQDSSGKLTSTLAREARAQLASIGIKLTLASEQLKQTVDPTEAQAVREHILRLKNEAKDVVDRYNSAKRQFEGGGPAEKEAPLDPILIFGEQVGGAETYAPPVKPQQQAPIYDQAQALAMDSNPLIFEISEMSLPRPAGMPRPAETDTGPGVLLDAMEEPPNLLGGASLRGMGSRGGRIGQALALAVDATSGQTIFGVYIPALTLQLSTVALILEYGGSEDAVVAAAIDSMADGPNGEQAMRDIKSVFGADVAELVEWSSWLKQIDPWEQRDRGWTKTILDAPPQALFIGICWRMASLAMLSRRYRSGGTGALERAGRERDRLLWIHRALAKACRTVETAPLVDAWELVISDLERRGGG